MRRTAMIATGLFVSWPWLGLEGQECTTIPGGEHEVVRYERHRDIAHFYVTPLGTVFQRPGNPVDENDDVVVHVYTNLELAKQLEVARRSPFRSVGTINIVGAQAANVAAAAKQDSLLVAPPTCDLTVRLSDFAPGRAVIGISAVTTETADNGSVKEVSFGEFDFSVRPLYSGAFSFGPRYSRLLDRSYNVAVKGGSGRWSGRRVRLDRTAAPVARTP